MHLCTWKFLGTPLSLAGPLSSSLSSQELHAAEVRRNKEQREEMSG